MTESLRQAKERLRRQFLGRAGLHGLGLRPDEDAICVYADADETPDQQALLAEIEQAAKPFRIIVIRDQKPWLLR